MSYGEKLRRARKAAGLTQAQAADVLKISKRHLEKIEAGEVIPPSDGQAITRERLLATLENIKAAPGRSNIAGQTRPAEPLKP